MVETNVRRRHSRMDVTRARETKVRRTGFRLRKSRDSATQIAAQPAIGARHCHGMAEAQHRTALIYGAKQPRHRSAKSLAWRLLGVSIVAG
jgi:hypothetical protein